MMKLDKLGIEYLALALALTACESNDSPQDGGGQDTSTDDGGRIDFSVRPTKRSDFWAVADPTTGVIALFGGDHGPIVDQIPRADYLDETWVFDPGAGWTEIVAEPHPSARGRYGAAYDANQGRMIIFGGRWRQTGASGDYTLYNDLWAFDFETRTWEMLHDGSGTAPPARYFSGVAVDPDDGTMYVTSGGLNANALAPDPASDVWSFNGTEWTEVTTTGDLPGDRLFVSWIHDTSRNRLVAYSGQVGDFVSPSFRDLHALDLSTGTWSQLHDGNGTAPTPRFNGMGSYDADEDRYLFFGGHADFNMLNSLWSFDPTDNTFSELRPGDTTTGAGLGCLGNPSEIPATFLDQDLDAPQGRQTGGFVVLNGRGWVLMGESDCSDHLDDVWSVDLATNTWTEVFEARAGESCARRGDDCTCLCL